MRWTGLRGAVVAVAAVGGVLAVPSSAALGQRAGDDAVVIAVIDSGFSPYHWDFLAQHMPQASSRTRADDLPLTRAPHTWLRGFPRPSSFDAYQELPLTLDARNASRNQQALADTDDETWLDVAASTREETNFYWIPGTKVIGALTFGVPAGRPIYGGGASEHGMGTASVSVGNRHGTCPECLLVFIQAGDYEAAIDWAMSQPWIDAISNSYGASSSLLLRDRVYTGANTALQRVATERGQTIFFSAGNGLANDFVAPNGTLLSSQEGPDWIVTVGATDHVNVDYPGSGKPADIAAIGSDYPSSYGSQVVTGRGVFGGTSSATPTVAGTYGRALYRSRRALLGPSRTQARGVVATGRPVACGRARAVCELGDGRLTREELQRRVFEGATPTKGGYAGRRRVHRSVLGRAEIPPPVGGAPVPFVTTPPVADERFLSEGYGTYRARFDGTRAWNSEFDRRVWLVLLGRTAAPRRPRGEVEWFRVDSWCRQHIWGEWGHGAFRGSRATPLPARDPVGAPSRTAYQDGCPALTAPPG